MSARRRVCSASDAELEAAIEARPDDVGLHRVYGDWLAARGDPRGDLITVQCDLEEASGPRYMELKVAELELLSRHTTHFLGPLARSWKAHPTSVEWRRGFVEHVDVPPAPLEKFFGHPSARFLSRVSVRSLPSATPRTIERLYLRESSVDDRLVALERLRELRFGYGASSRPAAPLRFPHLEAMHVAYTGFLLGTLAQAELPVLRELSLHVVNTNSERAPVTALVDVVQKLGVERLAIGLGPESSQSRWWERSALVGLAPIAERLGHLVISLPSPLPDGLALPSLRRLTLQLNGYSPRPTREELARLPLDVPKLEELDLDGIGSSAGALDFSRAVSTLHYPRRVRTLRISIGAIGVGKTLSRLRAEEARTLDVRCMGEVVCEESDDLLAGDGFSRVKKLSLSHAAQLGGVTRSAVARRIEELRVALDDDRDVASWLAQRPSFSSLQVLTVSGRRLLSAESLLALGSQAHDVRWARGEGDERREASGGVAGGSARTMW